jgi:hypothetical protein
MLRTGSKTSAHPSRCVLCNFVSCSWVSVGNSQLNVEFQFLLVSWVVRMNFLFQKSPKKEVWRDKVWRSLWPKAQQCALQRKLAVKRFFNVAQRLTCKRSPTPDMFPVRNISCVPKFCYQSMHCCFTQYATSLSGYALLNASRTAANDFDAK